MANKPTYYRDSTGHWVKHDTSNTIDPATFGTGIDATKIADGSVTNAEFQYLGGVTSDLQTQINGKAATSHTHNLSAISDVTASAAEVNILDGALLDVNELNVLNGITATTAELNILDGVTANAGELNILDGATLTVTELNYVDGVTGPIQTQIDALSASSNATVLTLDNNTGGTIAAGAPVRTSSGELALSRANSTSTATCRGLAMADITDSSAGNVVTEGPLTLPTADWDAVTGGSGGLTPDADYWVASGPSAGLLTTTPPTTAGQQQTFVGWAVADDTMYVAPQPWVAM